MSAEEPTGPYDPLAKLYRQRKALQVAGSRGEAVAEALHEIDQAIGSIIEQRAAQGAARPRPREQERER